MSSNLTAAQSALKLGSFISILTVASLGARLAAADISPDAAARDLGISAAHLSGGDLSDGNLHRIFGSVDPALFARHDPAMRPRLAAGILQGYEQGAPLSHWDLTPAAAQAANQGVPVADAPNPPAKPFIFHGEPVDREAAITCLTQAVYYEAGFEPIEGAQAVAQVVLNRVRHPIFPKSVCGVVYQGADLKTGCQFSFTCDGSLSKTPAAGAWARAQSVAAKALVGFVQKDVGEATHYHTQWILPWWAPTVSKVAQVGTQIFYRWPGDLGMPSAFTGRYAGGEHVGKVVPSTIATDIASADSGADGRVHAILAVSAAPAQIEAPIAVATKAPPPLEVATLKSDAPDLKVAPLRPVQSPFARPTYFGCSAGSPCQHW